MKLNYFKIGAALCGLSVAAGAFGAHALRQSLDSRSLEIFETAARLQMYHGLGLMILYKFSVNQRSSKLMLLGTLIFSGSLYALVFTGHKWLGAITPIGGVLLLISWVLVIIK